MTKPVYPMEELAAVAVHISKNRLNHAQYPYAPPMDEPDQYEITYLYEDRPSFHRTFTLDGARYFAQVTSPRLYVITYQGKVVEQCDIRWQTAVDNEDD